MRIVWTVVVIGALGCACGGAKATISTKASAVTAAPAGATIALDRAQIEVERVRLTPAGVQQQSSGTSGSETETGEEEVGAGPFHLDLTGAELSGQVSHAFDVSAAPGDYTRLKIRVHPDATTQKSIVLDGTFNGAAFTFSSSLDEDQERDGAFTIAAGGTANITLSFDTSKWFSDGQGGALDPSNASNQSRIESNIKDSLEAFEDDDHDGSDDSTESSGSH